MERVSSHGLAAASVRACAGLTSREIQILRNLALGKSDWEISLDLAISVKTVNHLHGSGVCAFVCPRDGRAEIPALLPDQSYGKAA